MAMSRNEPFVTNDQEEYFDWVCIKCEENDKIIEATFFCLTCMEAFCECCLKDHNRFLKKHTILGDTEKSEWGKSSRQPTSELECSSDEYSGQLITPNCLLHDVECCQICATLKHSKQDLQELKVLQKNENKHYQDLRTKIKLASETQERKFEVDMQSLVKDYDQDMDTLTRQQKQQVEKAEASHSLDLKTAIKYIKLEQEKELKGFKEKQKQDLKLMKQEFDMLAITAKKEDVRKRKEQKDIQLAEEEVELMKRSNQAEEEEMQHRHAIEKKRLPKILKQEAKTRSLMFKQTLRCSVAGNPDEMKQNLVDQLSENAKDHKAYNDTFDAATKWLALMEERVQDCNDTAGDWHTLEDRIEAIKSITAQMDEGLQKMKRVCDLAEKILPNTSSDGKRLIEQQVTELTNEWEKLNMSITDCNAMLEGVQERWNDYEEYYSSLVKWLAEMENTLGMDPEPKAQLVEKKAQLDKYKLMMGDIDNHQRMVNELAERVANLEALSKNPEITESLQDVQNRHDRVRNRCRDLLDRLDRNYQEHLGFHEAQQESEKWLLQTSFRIMNHNSLNCSTKELTQRQIDKHRMLLGDIEDYRITLDRVNMKGRRLIDNNAKVPRFAEQLQAQLQNLEESYINLQATAEQIRRLEDEFAKQRDE